MPEIKTNAMRMLDKQKIPYTAYQYPHEEGVAVDGKTVAEKIGKSPLQVFKTLVAQSPDKHSFVFVIPACDELDLKKAAKAAGVKSVEMIAVKQINAVTGYIRGGCSPVGMKKQFPTFLSEKARELDTVIVSAGKIGYQVELKPSDLLAATAGKTADITRENK